MFVCSTFVDMGPERDVLQEHVFPSLRSFCSARGFQLQAVDLRWGVSQEAALDHRAMPICLEELRRCRESATAFAVVVLVGDRYGLSLIHI